MRATSDPLAGTTWTLRAVRIGEAVTPISPDIHADARFSEGRIAGSGGCNGYTAAYEAGPGAIRVGPCASTMMACVPPRMEVERAFLAALEGARSWVFADGGLVLADADGTPLAELEAAPADAYAGSWEATAINNGREAVVSVEPGATVTLDLGADGRATGNATCNRFRGTFGVDGETITFGPLATTRMACPSDALAAQEAAYLAALAAAATWSVSGDRLELRDASGAMQATFRRA